MAMAIYDHVILSMETNNLKRAEKLPAFRVVVCDRADLLPPRFSFDVGAYVLLDSDIAGRMKISGGLLLATASDRSASVVEWTLSGPQNSKQSACCLTTRYAYPKISSVADAEALKEKKNYFEYCRSTGGTLYTNRIDGMEAFQVRVLLVKPSTRRASVNSHPGKRVAARKRKRKSVGKLSGDGGESSAQIFPRAKSVGKLSGGGSSAQIFPRAKSVSKLSGGGSSAQLFPPAEEVSLVVPVPHVQNHDKNIRGQQEPSNFDDLYFSDEFTGMLSPPLGDMFYEGGGETEF